MRPATQVVPIKPKTRRAIDKTISHGATPKGILTIITTGEVKGIIENQKPILLSGFCRILCATINESIKGMVIGNMNCCVSDSPSTAAPIAANKAPYNK
ncbi:MAG: hypothetical protein BWY67_01025 [Bacteroidetes bacterium ADurb.Bin397]|nr:MAG: hypothetical protein BWY67_01025 [Bacteroidetes bacterium ADurb.Bin397]